MVIGGLNIESVFNKSDIFYDCSSGVGNFKQLSYNHISFLDRKFSGFSNNTQF